MSVWTINDESTNYFCMEIEKPEDLVELDLDLKSKNNKINTNTNNNMKNDDYMSRE